MISYGKFLVHWMIYLCFCILRMVIFYSWLCWTRECLGWSQMTKWWNKLLSLSKWWMVNPSAVLGVKWSVHLGTFDLLSCGSNFSFLRWTIFANWFEQMVPSKVASTWGVPFSCFLEGCLPVSSSYVNPIVKLWIYLPWSELCWQIHRPC